MALDRGSFERLPTTLFGAGILRFAAATSRPPAMSPASHRNRVAISEISRRPSAMMINISAFSSAVQCPVVVATGDFMGCVAAAWVIG